MAIELRPLLRYAGGKFLLRNWIIHRLPQGHEVYVEPFGGSASILLAKPPHKVEHYNDIDERLVNLFRVLQDEERYRSLHHRLRYTLYAESEFRKALQILEQGTEDSVEWAWACFVYFNMGLSGDGTRDLFHFSTRSAKNDPNTFARKVESLEFVHKRLQRVVIHNQDALRLMRMFDYPNVLMYLDPPYPRESRSCRSALYRYEETESLHEQICEFLLNSQCAWALSTYPNKYYEQLSGRAGVVVHEKQTIVWMNRVAKSRKNLQRTELLYVYDNHYRKAKAEAVESHDEG